MAQSKDKQKDEAAGGAGTAGFLRSILLAILIGLGGGAAFGYLGGVGDPASPAKAAAKAPSRARRRRAGSQMMRWKFKSLPSSFN